MGIRRSGWLAGAVATAGMVVVGSLAIGCSSSERSAGTSGEDSVRSVPASGASAGAQTPSADEAKSTTAGSPSLAVSAPREIVSTATLRVVAADIAAASAKAEELVASRGGFVFGQEDGGAHGAAVLTLKVPSAAFRPLLTDVSRLGKVEARNVSTEDVTADGADLDARILSAQRSVDRVRAFLDQAKNVGELATVESELTRRETELEQLQGQRRVLTDRVSLATVTLTLSPEPSTEPTSDPLRSVPGFGGALASGVGALVKVGRVAAAAAGYALPFIAMLAVVIAVVRLARRWGRRSSPETGPLPVE